MNTKAPVSHQPGVTPLHRMPQTKSRPAIDNITRLLCARVYLFGGWAAIPTLFSLIRPIFHARDPSVGCNTRMVIFHAIQSTFFSLMFALTILLVLWPAGGPFGFFVVETDRFSTHGYFSGPNLMALILLIFKMAVFNPLVARRYFSKPNMARAFRVPVLSDAIEASMKWLLPSRHVEQANVWYFAGDRPFTGYGTEINAWTLVIDTSAASRSVHDFSGESIQTIPLRPNHLYSAVTKCVKDLGVNDLKIQWRAFLDGKMANRQREAMKRKFVRPPQQLESHAIEELDLEGESARQYLVLTMTNSEQDLIATQFIRFHANGRMLFCEFASYILSKGLGRLYFMDWLFGLQFAAYALAGFLLFLLHATLATAFLYVFQWALLSAGLIGETGILSVQQAIDIFPLFLAAPEYPLASTSILVLLMIVFWTAWRMLRGMFSMLGLVFNLSRQFGVSYSFRERFTSRKNLDYFSLQDVARFMKTQEKVLVKSICEQLQEHHIDGSDFKETLTSYINQGVINSGDIRGSVMTSLRSFVFRRPARSVAKRGMSRKAANG